MDYIGKKYKLESSDNFDEFMKVVGMNLVVRKLVGALKPTVELKKEDDSFVFVSQSSFKTVETKFKPGEVTDGSRPDGSKLKNIFTFEGQNILKQVETDDGSGLEVIYVREFGPDDLKLVMTAKDVTCSRIFKAIK